MTIHITSLEDWHESYAHVPKAFKEWCHHRWKINVTKNTLVANYPVFTYKEK